MEFIDNAFEHSSNLNEEESIYFICGYIALVYYVMKQFSRLSSPIFYLEAIYLIPQQHFMIMLCIATRF